ncbi:MAG: mannitol dehydrogenase family protein [Bacteroidales bacterium]|nr:mannitol dehydrogenase family protein [Bacteroidales bacterium]
MELTLNGIKNNAAEWKAKGFALPTFDIDKVREATLKAPAWIHFGAGNIFRAFQCNVCQNLLNAGVLDRGLVVAEGYDYEIIDKMYRPHDNIGVLVTLKASGNVEKTVVASIMESLAADSNNDADWPRLKEIFRNDSLQMVSFTITEKGYALQNNAGIYAPFVEEDFKAGPGKPQSYMGKVSALVYERFIAGEKPVAMVSMDNCSHNGDKLFAAVHAFAEAWEKNGVCKPGFKAYVENKNKVSFPWTMIDKITPRPDPSVEAILAADGLDVEPVVTAKKTFVAPFVNSEECEYLVIEDSFPNGHPALEKGGVMFTQRETVDKVEKMKVCTCLNPLHTALAVSGCLLGFEKISEEMKDADLKKMVEIVGYKEGLPVVVDPGIIKPKDFIDQVVNIRIPNPFMPDTPQRIATDTSQKLAIRFGETIKAYEKRPDLNVADLKVIPLVFALWLRYLMGVDDNGEKFELSPDPLLPQVTPVVAGVKLGEKFDVHATVEPILSKAGIFGVNLYETPLAGKVEKFFEQLCAGKGAIRKVIHENVQ